MAAVSSGKGRGLRFEIDLGSATSKSGRLRADEPMGILIVADCSGRRARGVTGSLAGRRARSISVDNLDRVFAAFGAELELADLGVRLSPRSLDDLHPDQLLRSVAPLRELVEQRHTPEGTAASQGASGADSDLLGKLLGAPASGLARPDPAVTPAGPRSVVDQLIRSAVGDAGLAAAPSSAQQARGAAAESELGIRLRALLHAPDFRALEATWRAIDGLCRSCPDEELLRYQVLDALPAELLAEPSAFEALLEAQRPSLVVVDDYVAASAEGIAALQSLLRACQAHGAILTIGASPALAGYASFAGSVAPPESVAPPPSALEAWQALAQARAEGAQLALALPRYLLRQPYGKLGESLDRLDFEEVLGGDHDAFPWGNPAYLAARALAERHAGAGSLLDGSVELSELPVVRVPDEDGYRLQPSAEAWLSERVVDGLRSAGFVILQGVRDSDRLRVHL
jgi:type VI secretion system protein ImpC